MKFSPGDRKMVEYLLGSLPEDERARIQERLFVDEEFFEAMRGVEADLLDAYARGRLEEGDRTRLESLLRESPGERKRASFARVLARTEPAQARRAGRQQGRNLAWAVAALLAGIVVWSGVEIRELRIRLGDASRRARLGGKLSAAAPVEAFVIWPGTLRGEGAAQSFRVTPGTALVRLTLPAESLAAGQPATATLKTEAGAPVWEDSRVAVQTRESMPVADLYVPSNRMPAGDYRLLLRQPSGVLADYRFRVLP